MRLFFNNGPQLCHIDTFLVFTIKKIRLLVIEYVIFAIRKSVQYRLNKTHDEDMKYDHFVRDQSCTDPERRLAGGGGGGGGQVARTHLENHKFNKE